MSRSSTRGFSETSALRAASRPAFGRASAAGALDQNRLAQLAWAGWWLEIPWEWQPLKLNGTPEKGRVIVGDNQCAIFLLTWERLPARQRLDGAAWVAGRLNRLGLHPQPDPPAQGRLSACGWARGVQTEEDKKTTYWFGYDEPARLLLGMTINGVLPEALRRTVEQVVLPSLRTMPVHKPRVWAMYDLSFVVPAGFDLRQRHLFSGDMALEFEHETRETLLLRQVYPGDLALNRRSHEQWMDCYPFRVHRRLRKSSVRLEPWLHGSRSELRGVRRRAWQRLPPPLGWCAARQSCGLAVHDATLNRLLLAEHRSPSTPDETVCEQAIEQMNRSHTDCGKWSAP